jgi:phosphoribosylformylglycinamidine (FGAM) synthase-like amidotransferase family enzyme
MPTVFKPKRSEVAAAIPTSGQLEAGEIAINITDGKFYTKTTAGVVKEVGGAGSVTLQGATNSGNTTTNDIVLNGSNLVFEGSIENAFETILTVVEPTGDRTITLPNQNGTVAMVDDALALSIVFGG